MHKARIIPLEAGLYMGTLRFLTNLPTLSLDEDEPSS